MSQCSYAKRQSAMPKIHSKSKWTPYDGLKIKGIPVFTIVNGKLAMEENQIINEVAGKKVLFKD